MGRMGRHISFDGRPPSPEAIRLQLAEQVNMPVTIKMPDQYTMRISFTNYSWFHQRFTKTIYCEYNSRSIFINSDLADGLHKYPSYFESAIAACLIDLGGKYPRPLPEHAHITYSEWVKLNGRATPPLWKSLLLSIGKLIYTVFFIPIILLCVPMIWFFFFVARVWEGIANICNNICHLNED